jgi:hypothetical protein
VHRDDAVELGLVEERDRAAYFCPTDLIGASWLSRWSAQHFRSARVAKDGASLASLPTNTATGPSVSMSEPVKSALKSPVSRLRTSNGWSVASNSPPLSRPFVSGPPGTTRAVVFTWTCVFGCVPTRAR